MASSAQSPVKKLPASLNNPLSNPALLVYAPTITPRLTYIFKLMLGELLGLRIAFTSNSEEVKTAAAAVLNYSEDEELPGIRFHPAGLLFHKDIFEQDIFFCNYQGEASFFTVGEKGEMPFDPFSASFYLVSRYEEYLPHIADEHGRFMSQNSILYRCKALQKPLVNIWTEAIATCLIKKYPDLTFNRPTFKFISTIDVDNAYAFRGKGLFRTLGAIGKDLKNLDYNTLSRRLLSIGGFRRDPYDTFDYQHYLKELHGFECIYFMLFSKFSSHDRNLSPQSHLYQRYIKGVNDHAEIGLHPSYRSHKSPEIIEEERDGLERVINQKVTKSRQHYLKMQLPQTLRRLHELNIRDDYSMGYPEVSGFRAGICHSFNFYDLELEIEQPLRIHPLILMDVTYIDYLNWSPEQATVEILDLLKTVKNYGGEFIPVWHNRTFSEAERSWKGWNEVYETMIAAACKHPI
jgi:hypothetical protein